nr:hypothetical protein CFP56_33707 [Quercus suber]
MPSPIIIRLVVPKVASTESNASSTIGRILRHSVFVVTFATISRMLPVMTLDTVHSLTIPGTVDVSITYDRPGGVPNRLPTAFSTPLQTLYHTSPATTWSLGFTGAEEQALRSDRRHMRSCWDSFEAARSWEC